ncbi:hypothetical protein BC936DRAFT_136782 [Jimgerdemannia flammicorona]|uniref:Uncharacterized protein n=1 Tax=Jimgerdemannia flammicorona TaxID=994334 RepID=A0A433DJB4_9FUNG|nr:hypothetical protein BC936DRAFT_136782 [Jimgerdemannia flammicorona]
MQEQRSPNGWNKWKPTNKHKGSARHGSEPRHRTLLHGTNRVFADHDEPHVINTTSSASIVPYPSFVYCLKFTLKAPMVSVSNPLYCDYVGCWQLGGRDIFERRINVISVTGWDKIII